VLNTKRQVELWLNIKQRSQGLVGMGKLGQMALSWRKICLRGHFSISITAKYIITPASNALHLAYGYQATYPSR
jgi:hypothetical protein